MTIASGATQAYQGGFITFPAAEYQADPASFIRSTATGDTVSEAQPVLHGDYGPPFYDLARHRWLPVRPAQTSPDGAFYAYTTDLTKIHIVDVASGSDRVLTLGIQAQGASIEVADFDGRRVYFVYQTASGPQGVWRLDVASGSVTRIASLAHVDIVQAGYAWVSAIDPRDPNPPQYQHGGPPEPAYDSIVRVNLATGDRAVWFYAPGQAVILHGLDHNGRPVVEVAPSPVFEWYGTDIRLVTSPGDGGTQVYKGRSLDLWPNTGPQQDVGRLWFGTDHGIYLFTGSTGLQKVFAFYQPSAYVLPAGFCV